MRFPTRRVLVLGVVLAIAALVMPPATVRTPDASLVKVQTAQAVDHPRSVVWILCLGSDARPGPAAHRHPGRRDPARRAEPRHRRRHDHRHPARLLRRHPRPRAQQDQRLDVLRRPAADGRLGRPDGRRTPRLRLHHRLPRLPRDGPGHRRRDRELEVRVLRPGPAAGLPPRQEQPQPVPGADLRAGPAPAAARRLRPVRQPAGAAAAASCARSAPTSRTRGSWSAGCSRR